jgi:hypothetical protein
MCSWVAHRECEVGRDDIGGIAAHTGTRVRAGPNAALVSTTLRDLVI